jgi:hypothetical protein
MNCCLNATSLGWHTCCVDHGVTMWEDFGRIFYRYRIVTAKIPLKAARDGIESDVPSSGGI